MSPRYTSSRKKRKTVAAPFVAFLLVASFGILLVGCKGPESASENQDFVFTQENVDQAHQLAQKANSGSVKTESGSAPYLQPVDAGTGAQKDGELVLDLSMVSTYNSIRTGLESSDKTIFHVTNEFLNIRNKPSTTADSVARLNYGDAVQVLSFLNATWAQVKLANGATGYASVHYLARMTTDEKLADEKSKYDGRYFVSYGFVNMRKEPKQASEKIGEIPGQTIVKPDSISGDWAKVTYNGQTGYIATSYLTRFLPTFIVRQNSFTLPVLHYQMTKGQEADILKALTSHVALLKQQGVNFITFGKFHDMLLDQQKHDVKIDGNNAVIAITGVTPDNVRTISDALNAAGVNATLFIQTQYIGLSGITQKTLLTLIANGFDIESNTHTGDDLRALTNAQVDLEMKQSRKIIQDLTSTEVSAVAYPQGGSNQRVIDLASGAGYLLGLGTGSDRTFTRDQLLNIPGIDIFPNMAADEVSKLVTGK